MTFSERVKQVKSEKNLTSAELSERSGIPLGTLTKLLSGAITEPKLSTALAIAHALDCPLGFLACCEDSFIAETLTEVEGELLANFRICDDATREMVQMILAKGAEAGKSIPFTELQVLSAEEQRAKEEAPTATILEKPVKRCSSGMRTLPIFLLPVSAGLGSILDNGSDHEYIQVPSTRNTDLADYALRVSGHSMEPNFNDGDVLLIHSQQSVNFGDLGVFVGDGEGYFKRFMGDRLRSLNPEFPDIPLCRFQDFLCCGKVVGHMKRRRS